MTQQRTGIAIIRDDSGTRTPVIAPQFYRSYADDDYATAAYPDRRREAELAARHDWTRLVQTTEVADITHQHRWFTPEHMPRNITTSLNDCMHFALRWRGEAKSTGDQEQQYAAEILLQALPTLILSVPTGSNKKQRSRFISDSLARFRKGQLSSLWNEAVARAENSRDTLREKLTRTLEAEVQSQAMATADDELQQAAAARRGKDINKWNADQCLNELYIRGIWNTETEQLLQTKKKRETVDKLRAMITELDLRDRDVAQIEEQAKKRRRIFKRAVLLVRSGEYSEAVKTLEQTPMAPATLETLRTLQELHPEPSQKVFSPKDTATDGGQSWEAKLLDWKRDINPDSIETYHVAQAIRNAAKRRTHDRWGWRAEFTFPILSSPDLLKLFHGFILDFLRCECTEKLYRDVAGSRLTANLKPNNRGIRPIGITDIIRKIAERTIAIRHRDDIRDALISEDGRVLQLG